mmetsp:Transcript_11701/g.21286  ORF Transcript_11701/g.21286 Transcript_11701/m.21286 type:complete len:396 (-) Transcript_11701:99-1286(-)
MAWSIRSLQLIKKQRSRFGFPEQYTSMSQLDADATKIDYWPPRRQEIPFDWDVPTNEAYDVHKVGMYAPSFEQARAKLDYSYHKNPKLDRQEFQDNVLKNVIQAVEKSRAIPPNNNERPWIVFTAGPMGVGKSYVLSQLHQRDCFPLGGFMKIDPDMIKSELPEVAGYLQRDPETAATKLHRESTQISDVLFEYSLLSNHNILVDGSLRDRNWYTQLLDRLRKEFPRYRLAIMYVNATSETIHNRAEVRAEKTGRAVPKDLLQESIDQVPISVSTLSPLTDVTFEISNDDGKPMILKKMHGNDRESMTWEDFRAVWHSPEQEKDDSAPTEILCHMMAHCNKANEHEAANIIWKSSYPSFCPRCTIAADEQCGLCIHGRHFCVCSECYSNAIPLPK